MTITIPDSPAGLEDALSDKKLMAELKTKSDLRNFIQGYADAHAKKDRAEVIAQAKEQAQLTVAEMLADNGGTGKPKVDLSNGPAHNRAPMISGLPHGQQTKSVYNRRAPGAHADGIFDDASEFFRATWHHSRRLKDWNELAPKVSRLQEIQNSYGSEVPGDGGFLIPEQLRSEILQLALETAIVRSRATTIPMSSLRVPIPTIDDPSHVSSILGGVVAYWTEEAASLTESQASFGRVVLDAKKLTAYAEVPNELLMDAPAFEGFFSSTFPKAISWFEDVAFLTGTGVGEPMGFINSPVAVTQAVETGQNSGTGATLVWENIVKMYSRMLPTSLGRAVWIVSPDTFPQLATMALSVGTGGGPVWIGNFSGGNGGDAAPPATILGRPVLISEKVGPLGTTGDIAFVDLSYYLIGDRMEMQVSASEHYKFANDKTAYRVVSRLDGRPWLQTALTPKNGGPTLSPVVQLGTRS